MESELGEAPACTAGRGPSSARDIGALFRRHGEHYRRTHALGAIERRAPQLRATGAHCSNTLPTLVELRDVLDEPHLVEILNRAAGRTEEQVEELVAALRPQPIPTDLLRRLPVRGMTSVVPGRHRRPSRAAAIWCGHEELGDGAPVGEPVRAGGAVSAELIGSSLPRRDSSRRDAARTARRWRELRSPGDFS
jgi:hypothetical protein